jgi:diguanylate cyclase (GGDEF)-like protein
MFPTLLPRPALRLRGLLRIMACAAACMLILPGRAAPDIQPWRPQVLVLLSYHPGYSWEDRILAGIQEWSGDAAAKPRLHAEWMDTKRYPGMEQRQRLVRYLADKYAHQRFDLIATVDDNALDFVVRQPALFGDTPVVFSGVNGEPAQLVGHRPKVTGILERFDLDRTLRTALSLHPGTRHLVFITPRDDIGTGLRAGVDAMLARQPPGPQTEHWITPELSSLGERLQQQPGDTLVFVLGAIPPEAGRPPLEPEEVVAFVHARTSLPVYSDLDTSVGRGAVGGYLNSGLETGRLQAAMAQRILSGQDPSQIPYVRETPLALQFDYRELHRLGLKARRLPEGSTLLNEPASIFDSEYRRPLIGFSLVVALLLASVAALAIRSRVLAERQRALHYQSTHDDLTGLPNRHGLPQLLQASRGAASEHEHVALVMLGLNRFKLVNDTYGHAFGDTVVAAVAERLRNWRSDREALVRFGGDSFVIVSHFRGLHALERLRARCEALLSQPFIINGQRIPVTAAFGMSTAPLSAQDPERLLREADTAMHEAKRNRRTQVEIFDRRIHVRTTRQFQIEASLPDAIARGEIEVYFQPIMDTASHCIAGFEALARWQHPALGAIPPPEFIRAATESGHIGALTQCVLRKACLAFLPHLASPTQPYLAVNVSVSDIYGGEFPAQLARTLARMGMPADRLVLEVTEDMLLGDEHLAAETLAQLHSQGVRIAIDDFGTGYSSMGYLSHYKVHAIKIDRSFVREITTNPQDQKIVRAIISMASDLNLGVVTEGVETEEQSALLRGMGCVLQQGYAFGRPRPAADWAGQR